MFVHCENNQETIELPEGSSGKDLVDKLNLNSPNQGLAIRVNEKTYDLDRILKEGDQVFIWSFEENEGKEIFWHTSAHILAQAVMRLWPEAKPTIGPPIQEGFYYDFANLNISEEDFPVIEKEIKAIIRENYKPVRTTFSSSSEALKAFSRNPYKQEVIQEVSGDERLTAYKQGEFFDLCRGPHLPNLGKVKSLKILKISGAYWRGDAKNEMLTRIYACSFPEKKLMQQYIQRIEEAKKRDHKVVGPKLGLFSLKEEAPGMPFIHPKGMLVWNQLIQYWNQCHKKAAYQEIKTPTMMTKELWEVSGHWENYRENMFTSKIEDREFAIKPMNCPGCMLYYKSNVHSYRELPLKVAEIGHVHRYEPSGAISGLFRVRSFHQDDAHIFLTYETIEKEVINILALAHEMYTTFGLSYHLELSTRPEKNTIGSDEDWEKATQGLHKALLQSGKEFRINEGDGAFYGPKIDFHLHDALGRTWQCGTIQLDMALPERFKLDYVSPEGTRERPVMIHRALYGSIERFFGILIENFSGRFPLWLSPLQVRFLPISDRHVPYAKSLLEEFKSLDFICDIDTSHESVSKKVRNAQLQQINYMITIGDQELESKLLSIRTRENIVLKEVIKDTFIQKIQQEIVSKALVSPYSKEL